MKNYLNKALVALLALGVTSQVQAYRYTFSNHTSKTIAAAIKFQGSKWYEFVVVPKDTMRTIAHGNRYIPNQQTAMVEGSVGLVPSQFFYLVNPPYMTTENQQTVPWRGINITWIPSESYSAAIDAAEAIGDMTETVAKTGAKAAAAYATAGASAAAEAAADAVKTATAKSGASAAAKQAVADSNFNFGKFLSAIGKSAARSFIGDHHIDIVEDENGKISFITML
jgi:hypothetical protein